MHVLPNCCFTQTPSWKFCPFALFKIDINVQVYNWAPDLLIITNYVVHLHLSSWHWICKQTCENFICVYSYGVNSQKFIPLSPTRGGIRPWNYYHLSLELSFLKEIRWVPNNDKFVFVRKCHLFLNSHFIQSHSYLLRYQICLPLSPIRYLKCFVLSSKSIVTSSTYLYSRFLYYL